MTHFITLNSTQAQAVSRYKQEVRAIVVDRAADHIEQRLPTGRKPTERQYEKAFAEGLMRAKLEVMAELFRLMHDLARDNTVAEWSRGDNGLRRKPRSDIATLKLIAAYDRIVRYVSGIRAHARSSARSGTAARPQANQGRQSGSRHTRGAAASRRK